MVDGWSRIVYSETIIVTGFKICPGVPFGVPQGQVFVDTGNDVIENQNPLTLRRFQ